MPSDLMSDLAPIAVHLAAILAAGATVALLASVSDYQLVGAKREDEWE